MQCIINMHCIIFFYNSVIQGGIGRISSKLHDNILQVTFNTAIAGHYTVVVTAEFIKGSQAWGWTQTAIMIYDKTSTGFKIDFYTYNDSYTNFDVVLNWVALSV